MSFVWIKRGRHATHPLRTSRRRHRARAASRAVAALIERLEDRTLLSAVIEGLVFEDLNGSGLKDIGEPGVAGVTIFLDQNQNGLADAGEQATLTGPDGSYQFTGLAAGTWTVAQLLSADVMQTSPGPATGPALLGDVLHEVPSPARIARGLEWANGSLYQPDDNGTPTIEDNVVQQIDPATGAVLGQFSAPAVGDVLDLTFDGTAFWGVAYETNQVVRFDAAGTILQQFDGPGLVPSSIAWDGSALWIADWHTRLVYQVSTAGETLRSIPAPDEFIHGMTFDGDHLWLIGRPDHRVYEIDPVDGAVLRSFLSRGEGLAFDGEALWVGVADDGAITRVDLARPGVHVVTVADGDVAAARDFGQFQLGAAAGVVFEDANTNGMRDPGEPGLEGWRVFVDRNGNDRFDRWERSTITDATGAYGFTTLRPGTHVITTGREPGWVATAAPAELEIAASGQVVSGIDLGYSLESLGPVGPEFLVNVTTAGIQQEASVAVDAAGNFAVAWQGNGPGDASGVFVRLFHTDGTPRTGEIRVNTTTANAQAFPYLAMAPDGRFAVTWRSPVDSTRQDAVVRLFRADGAPASGEIKFFSQSKQQASPLGIGMDANGNFAILYVTRKASGPFSSFAFGPFMVQRFNAQGVAQGAAISVAQPNLVNGGVDLAMDPAGNFTVVWAGDAGGGPGVWARRYTAAGAEIDLLQIVDGTQFFALNPTVAINSQRDFVVAWEDDTRGGRAAQTFHADGTPASSPFVFTAGGSGSAAVALDDQGSAAFFYPGDSSTGVFLGLYDFDGSPQSGELRVNTTLDGQGIPGFRSTAMAMTRGGDFVVAWRGTRGSESDGILAQRYQAPPPAPGITVTPASGLTTTEGGGTASFSVVLNAPPAADVTIALASSDTSEGTVSASSLTFTPENWNVPQSVTVIGVDDSIRDGTIAYTVVLAAATSADAAYNGLNPADVSVANQDNEKKGGPQSGSSSASSAGDGSLNLQTTDASRSPNTDSERTAEQLASMLSTDSGPTGPQNRSELSEAETADAAQLTRPMFPLRAVPLLADDLDGFFTDFDGGLLDDPGTSL